MAGAKIRLKIDFDGMLEAIRDAGGDMNKAALQAAEECAKAAHDELVAECNASGIPESVSGEIEHSVIVTSGGNRYEVEAGWKKGEYDPANPSAAYKAIFLNYGTPKGPRQVKKKLHVLYKGSWVTTANRGQIVGRGFIDRAQNGAKKKIKKVQNEALKKMLKELT